ncbi:YsnF/AvaK domain-containing protein, partial [Roseomonas sp. 18066]|uniref:YsnF/AvaK domain-containing protein n=1 Tax=Roseomonas sp. 18066 TaxID=2681412 RepID=UPI0013598B1C
LVATPAIPPGVATSPAIPPGVATSSAAVAGSEVGLVATPAAPPLAAPAAARAEAGEQVIPVVEEELRIGRRDVEGGRVKVRSYIVETPVTEQVSLRQEHVELQRRIVDRPVTAADQAFQDRTIEVRAVNEEAVVSKEARVTEELVVRKDATQRTETVAETLRRTQVELEDDTTPRRDGAGPPPVPAGKA